MMASFLGRTRFAASHLAGRTPRVFSFSVLVFGILFFGILSVRSFAQTATGNLRGRVTDPTGAVIPQATVTAARPNGQKATAVSDSQGIYEIKGLAPDTYSVNAVANGFAVSVKQNIVVNTNKVTLLDIPLEIEVQQEKVAVQEEATTVDVNPENTASSIIIKGKDLEALSDDPDELQSELQALAGPSAGPNGGQIYIDGFTGGQLPPKSSIREIRINQNPFSAQYDKLGYGRIEIFTKPGTNQYHGQVFAMGNDSSFNSFWTPVPVEEPSYHSEFFNGSVSGPLTGKGSFFFNAERRDINSINIVDATIVNPDLTTSPVNQAISNPSTRTTVSPRVDFQLSQNNTLTVRYQFTRNMSDNNGVGQFSIYPSQAYNLRDTEQTLQVSDTQVLGPHVVNETRFQYIRDSNNESPLIPPGLTTSVLGVFTSGGNSQGTILDNENHFEMQNYTSITHNSHLIKFGVRLRDTTDSNQSQPLFNGMYTFPSLPAYENTLSGTCPAAMPSAQCGPSQFSIAVGQPAFHVNLVDAGLYAEDDWRLRPNMMLSYGLRFETQNEIHDHADFAPRLTFSWGLRGGKKTAPKTVLRAGFGIFYDRFTYDLALQAERLNAAGNGQTQYVVSNPSSFTYPNIPPESVLKAAGASPTYFTLDPNLRAPSVMQSAVSVERQVTKKATVAVTYLNSRGEHQLFLANINAPLPQLYPAQIVRPNAGIYGNENVFQYTSEGIFRQNQLIANFRLNLGPRLSLFGFYSLNNADSDLGTGSAVNGGTSVTGGFTSGGSNSTPQFLSDPYNPIADYGRASFDIHDRALVGGTLTLPRGFRLSPFIVANSGTPYNLTVGQDLYGADTFNDRPAFVSAATCPVQSVSASNENLVCTPLGTFNTAPAPGQAVPVNFGTGPTEFTANFRLSKTFGFGREVGASSGVEGGPRGGPGGGHGGPPGGGLGGRGLSGGGGGGFFGAANTNRRYNLTFSVFVRNALNRLNLAPPVADVNSPLAGKYNSLASGIFASGTANRRLDLQVIFSF